MHVDGIISQVKKGPQVIQKCITGLFYLLNNTSRITEVISENAYTCIGEKAVVVSSTKCKQELLTCPKYSSGDSRHVFHGSNYPSRLTNIGRKKDTNKTQFGGDKIILF